jgi:hypothetical protein
MMIRFFLLFLIFFAQTRVALAADEGPIVVVLEDFGGLKDEAVRRAIQTELARPVLTDPTGAGDRLTVSVKDGRVRMRFQTQAQERELALGATENARVREIAMLARNMVNEPAPSTRRENQPPTTREESPAISPRRDSATHDGADEEAYQRLETTLRYHRDNETRILIPMGIAELTLGALAIPMGLHVRNYLDEETAGNALIIGGSSVALRGSLNLIEGLVQRGTATGLYGEFVREHGKKDTGVLVRDTEKAWSELARTERTVRRVTAGIAMGVGVAGVGVASWGAYAASNRRTQDDGRGSVSALLLGTSALSVLIGLYAWLTPSEHETNYEAYRRSSGRVQLTPSVAVSPTGGSVSLRGTF